MADFEVRRDDLRTTRTVESDPPATIADGEVLLRVDRFGLTSNNVTSGAIADMIGYWRFFPAADEGWGRVPAWGYGDVVSSEVDGIEPGQRFYGYLPMGSHLVVRPKAGGGGFTDTSEHRADLPPVYNRYLRVEPDAAHADEQLILRPLFGTSFLLDDMLRSDASPPVDAVVLSSASSKTAYGLAFLLARAEDGPHVIGLTSPRNRGFVEQLGLFDRVVEYDAIADALTGTDTLGYVDFAGDATVRAAVHRAAADRLAHSTVVGVTHWEDATPADGAALPGPAPKMFFAPAHIERLTEQIGGPELQRRMGEAWDALVPQLPAWLEIDRLQGADALEEAWLALVAGDVDPRRAQVVGL